MKTMTEIAKAAKEAASVLAVASEEIRNKALLAMANALRAQQETILIANQKDIEHAKQQRSSAAFLDRLLLTAARIEAMAHGVEMIAALPDPLGKKLAQWQRPNGMEITRVSVPIGVMAVIYESRPNVTADAAALCLKSGNAVILRGGSESFFSSTAIINAIHHGLENAALPLTAVQIVPTPDRAALTELLKLEPFIDVVIPRGGSKLIEFISETTRIPVLKHLAGLCHSYVHEAANKDMAKNILLNAKMRRTGICGATEVLLIDKKIVNSHLPDILNTLIQGGCEIRGDHEIQKINSEVKLVNGEDYDTEFLDAIIAVKIVNDVSQAILHIKQHGTQHTDAIITEDSAAAEKFLNEVDSAIVMHNTSTQFADGTEFGMGAEIGIATGKLHARGPVGVEQLTTFKYQVRGDGQVRS